MMHRVPIILGVLFVLASLAVSSSTEKCSVASVFPEVNRVSMVTCPQTHGVLGDSPFSQVVNENPVLFSLYERLLDNSVTLQEFKLALRKSEIKENEGKSGAWMNNINILIVSDDELVNVASGLKKLGEALEFYYGINWVFWLHPSCSRCMRNDPKQLESQLRGIVGGSVVVEFTMKLLDNDKEIAPRPSPFVLMRLRALALMQYPGSVVSVDVLERVSGSELKKFVFSKSPQLYLVGGAPSYFDASLFKMNKELAQEYIQSLDRIQVFIFTNSDVFSPFYNEKEQAVLAHQAISLWLISLNSLPSRSDQISVSFGPVTNTLQTPVLSHPFLYSMVSINGQTREIDDFRLASFQMKSKEVYLVFAYWKKPNNSDICISLDQLVQETKKSKQINAVLVEAVFDGQPTSANGPVTIPPKTPSILAHFQVEFPSKLNPTFVLFNEGKKWLQANIESADNVVFLTCDTFYSSFETLVSKTQKFLEKKLLGQPFSSKLFIDPLPNYQEGQSISTNSPIAKQDSLMKLARLQGGTKYGKCNPGLPIATHLSIADRVFPPANLIFNPESYLLLGSINGFDHQDIFQENYLAYRYQYKEYADRYMMEVNDILSFSFGYIDIPVYSILRSPINTGVDTSYSMVGSRNMTNFLAYDPVDNTNFDKSDQMRPVELKCNKGVSICQQLYDYFSEF